MNSIFSKVNARLKFLYRQSNSLSTKTRKNLCSALIRVLCHFDYSCSSWYAGLNKALKKQLQIAQNKVIRFINQLGPRTRITLDILMNLNLPYKFYVLGQIGLSKQCRPRSDCFRSSLIRVYAVCHSISIFWMH